MAPVQNAWPYAQILVTSINYSPSLRDAIYVVNSVSIHGINVMPFRCGKIAYLVWFVNRKALFTAVNGADINGFPIKRTTRTRVNIGDKMSGMEANCTIQKQPYTTLSNNDNNSHLLQCE